MTYWQWAIIAFFSGLVVALGAVVIASFVAMRHPEKIAPYIARSMQHRRQRKWTPQPSQQSVPESRES